MLSCRYDERVPVDMIEDAFDAVEDAMEPNLEGLTFNHFYLWLVLMFGGCSNADFESSAFIQFFNI